MIEIAVAWLFRYLGYTSDSRLKSKTPPSLIFFFFQIYDYEQFYLDLRNANVRKSADWTKEYEFLSYYKLKGITAEEMHNLAENLSRTNESPIFEQYVNPLVCIVSKKSWKHYIIAWSWKLATIKFKIIFKCREFYCCCFFHECSLKFECVLRIYNFALLIWLFYELVQLLSFLA